MTNNNTKQEWAQYPLVHLNAADLTFRLHVEKQINRLKDMWKEDPHTAQTPEFRAGVANKLQLAVAEYDARLTQRATP